jgi:hypothetical protein
VRPDIGTNPTTLPGVSRIELMVGESTPCETSELLDLVENVGIPCWETLIKQLLHMATLYGGRHKV